MRVLFVPHRRSEPGEWKGLGLAAVIALLLLPASAHAAHSKGGQAERADSLSAAAVAFELRYGTLAHTDSSTVPRDRWLGRDKGKHVVFSGLWTLSTQYVLVNKAGWTERDALPASIASGAAIGIAKEVYDATRPAGTVSGKDLVADAVGIGLAVGVILL